MSPTPHARQRFSELAPRRARAFTLIEAALATMIVGIGIVASLSLFAAGSMSNTAATEMTTAVQLANNVHEMMLGLPLYDPLNPGVWNTKKASVALYDCMVDFDKDVYAPPLDVNAQPMGRYPGWSQSISVKTVAPDQLASVRPDDPSAATARITISVFHNNQLVHQSNWLACAPNAP